MGFIKNLFAPDLAQAINAKNLAEERAAFWERRFRECEAAQNEVTARAAFDGLCARNYSDSLVRVIVAQKTGAVLPDRNPIPEKTVEKSNGLSEAEKSLLWERATEIVESGGQTPTKDHITPVYEAMLADPDEYLTN